MNRHRNPEQKFKNHKPNTEYKKYRGNYRGKGGVQVPEKKEKNFSHDRRNIYEYAHQCLYI